MVGIIRTSSATSSRHTEYQVKPPRPQNSWILYRQEHCKQFTLSNPGVPQSDVSKLIAQQWKNESPEVRREWERKAEEEKAKHALKYPGYRYSPTTKDSKTKQKEDVKKEKKARRAQQSTPPDINADAGATMIPALPSPSSSTVPSPHPLPGPTGITPNPYSGINAGATVAPALPFSSPSTVLSSHHRPARIVIPPNPYFNPYAPNAGYTLSRTASLTHEGPADTNANVDAGATAIPVLPSPSPSTVPSPYSLAGSTVITPNPYFIHYPDTNVGATMTPALPSPSPSNVPSPYPLHGSTMITPNPYFIPYTDANVDVSASATVTPALPSPLPSTVSSPHPLSESTTITPNPYFVPYADTNVDASATVTPAVISPHPLPGSTEITPNPYFIPYVDTNAGADAGATVTLALPSPTVSSLHPLPGPTEITPDPYFIHYVDTNADADPGATATLALPSHAAPSLHPLPGPTEITSNPYFIPYAPKAGYTLPRTAPLTREGSMLLESYPQNNTQGMVNFNVAFDGSSSFADPLQSFSGLSSDSFREQLISNVDQFFGTLNGQYPGLLTPPSGNFEVLMGSQALGSEYNDALFNYVDFGEPQHQSVSNNPAAVNTPHIPLPAGDPFSNSHGDPLPSQPAAPYMPPSGAANSCMRRVGASWKTGATTSNDFD